MEPLGVAELGGRQVLRVGPQDGEIRVRIGPDYLEAELAPVDEGRAALATARDHVRGSEQEAVRCDHDRAAAAVQPSAAATAVRDAKVRDRGGEPLGDADHGARVGIECLGLARQFRGDERQPGHGIEASNWL